MADIQEMLASSSQRYWEIEAAYKNQNLPLTLALTEIQEKPGPVREGKREVPSPSRPGVGVQVPGHLYWNFQCFDA